jgi:hypothetical protein
VLSAVFLWLGSGDEAKTHGTVIGSAHLLYFLQQGSRGRHEPRGHAGVAIHNQRAEDSVVFAVTEYQDRFPFVLLDSDWMVFVTLSAPDRQRQWKCELHLLCEGARYSVKT